jgi:hypothetical protein
VFIASHMLAAGNSAPAAAGGASTIVRLGASCLWRADCRKICSGVMSVGK